MKPRISYSLSARKEAIANNGTLITIDVVHPDGTRLTHQGSASEISADVLADAIRTLDGGGELRSKAKGSSASLRCHRCSGSHTEITKCCDCGQPVGVVC